MTWALAVAIWGGNWNEGANSGSRCSNWNNAPTNSNNNIGSRGRCDDRILLCGGYGHAGRSHSGGQPCHPASANTLRGLA